MWYRALAAHFEAARRFGSAQFHLQRAMEVLPDDPVILFYAGAMYEALASAGVQSVPATRPAMSRELQLPSAQDEWRQAERLLRKSAAGGGPDEARLRLGRVLGHLGKHSDAAAMLRPLAAQLHDRRLRYFAELFLGTEEGALGHVNEARASFERAAALFPTAQSPLLALSDLHRASGNRAAALQALQRLEKLPAEIDAREDPWRKYHESFAADGDQQLAAVRASVDRSSPR
jgi:tetratricopeptide (TPR) repeat protein